MKGKTKRSKTNLGLPIVIFICFLFFIAGFFVSALFSQDAPRVRPRLRTLELVEAIEQEGELSSMPHGNTRGASIESIPFQVLSWKPCTLYFPNFATAEQCETIIKIAKTNLKPSLLALRKGETVESTKGTRIRYLIQRRSYFMDHMLENVR